MGKFGYGRELAKLEVALCRYTWALFIRGLLRHLLCRLILSPTAVLIKVTIEVGSLYI